PQQAVTPGEPKTHLCLPPLHRPGQHRADIRVLAVQLSRRRKAPWAANVGVTRPRFGKRQVVQRVSPAGRAALVAGDRMLLGILSNRLEQVIPGLTLALPRDD